MRDAKKLESKYNFKGDKIFFIKVIIGEILQTFDSDSGH